MITKKAQFLLGFLLLMPIVRRRLQPNQLMSPAVGTRLQPN